MIAASWRACLTEEALAECFLGRFAEALGRGQESLALYQELNDRYPLPNTHLIVANILLHLGDWEGCRAHAEQAVAFISWDREQGYTLWAHTLYSAVALANGDYGLAKQHGLEAIRLARQTEVRYQNSPAYSTVGVAALLSGDGMRPGVTWQRVWATSRRGRCCMRCCSPCSAWPFSWPMSGDEIAAARVYLAIRHYPQIADSVFCQQVAGRHLETLLDRLTPEQLAAVHAAPAPSDLRALAAEMRAKLEAMG